MTLRFHITPIRITKIETTMRAHAGKWNTPPFPVRVQTCTVTREITMAVPQKIGKQSTLIPTYITLWHIAKGFSIPLAQLGSFQIYS